jgi:hypothetical protein
MRLEFMMRCAKALTISQVEGLATITKLGDVVGIDAVLGVCLGASVAMVVDRFTPTTGTGFHLRTPRSELWGIVDRVLVLGC